MCRVVLKTVFGVVCLSHVYHVLATLATHCNSLQHTATRCNSLGVVCLAHVYHMLATLGAHMYEKISRMRKLHSLCVLLSFCGHLRFECVPIRLIVDIETIVEWIDIEIERATSRFDYSKTTCVEPVFICWRGLSNCKVDIDGSVCCGRLQHHWHIGRRPSFERMCGGILSCQIT